MSAFSAAAQDEDGDTIKTLQDRELLELAAKAAGYPWRGFSAAGEPLLEQDMSKPEPRLYCPVVWNPLDDDGDALRLAVRLYLDINQFPATDGYVGMIEIWRNGDGDPAHVEYVKVGDDRFIATRRAIVRAAAEIGGSMK